MNQQPQKFNVNAIWTAVVAALVAPKLAALGVHLPPEQVVAGAFIAFHALEPYAKAWLNAHSQPASPVDADALAKAIVQAIKSDLQLPPSTGAHT